uniref:Homing endonuclease LAGLIDADG domain-containing protein n=1 Tax=Chromera velia CCMP2878 TaxID=1169474 RepID=A0A0G4F5G1_9ALVE|eukprot:Cvel_15137.t1-p1 / transcript=Cvel_15137.t1 / gene=Cvel_15137 / organism=Chromera_velia_CCMP2878 / gene_product=hypothetical protein / transcript_product=hypothetical protein / location=Cvel_scaffold1104:48297-49169(-) / protein_length=291 / sequence_SO=supercontig / SO=protein_coding / is_pseudo=false
MGGLRRYFVNQSYFRDGIRSGKQAWVWGALMSDGYVGPHYLNWTQKHLDCKWVAHIRKELGSEHPIKFYCSDGAAYARLRPYSSELARDARTILKCEPGRKSFDVLMPEGIEPSLLSELVRAIFEGDGCAGFSGPYPSLSFVSGSKELLTEIRSAIGEQVLNGSYSRTNIGARKSCWYLGYTRREEVNAIAAWMYPLMDQENRWAEHGYMIRKTDRLRLIKKITEPGAFSRAERQEFVDAHRLKEQKEAADRLQYLTALSLKGTSFGEYDEYLGIDNFQIGFRPRKERSGK